MGQASCSAASPTTSPAPPTSPTTWCAAACARCRPSACPPGRSTRRGRRGGGGAQVAHRSPPAEAVAAIARRAALAAGAGRAADLLQVLLDLRQHAAGQHRPGDRSADGRAAARDFTIATPGVPGQPAHGLQGPSVRRRRAAQRQRHARPSADADDRRQPGARAAGADAGARSGWSTTAPSRAGDAAIRRALRRAARGRRRASPSSMRSATTT